MEAAVRLVNLEQFDDERGTLTIVQHKLRRERVFVISNVGPDVTRGHHANKQCYEVLICVAGECYVSAITQSMRKANVYCLNQPSLALHLPPMTWAFEFGFSRDAVLLALVSLPYDENDYITDYEEFMNWKHTK